MTKELLDPILSTGLVGVFCVIALLIAWRKDTQLNAEKDARISDGVKQGELLVALNRELVGCAEALEKIAERLEADARFRAEVQRVSHLDPEEIEPMRRPTPNQAFRPPGRKR